jgi:methylthioribose-1-phosphate isomerase
VNLHWALARMERVLRKSAPATRRELAWREARAIADEDKAANAAIGQHGLPLIAAIHAAFGNRQDNPPHPLSGKGGDHGGQAAPAIVNVMTHCNAGRLATVEHGTAISPIYAAHAAGLPVHVWVSETRPRNQGLLTAWELAEAGVPHTLIADNAAGLLLMQGKVDLVIVGADRIAANGDTANKVGTYLKALAARAHGVPFYVAAPLSTVDFACSGARIPIEERAAEELGAGSVPGRQPGFRRDAGGIDQRHHFRTRRRCRGAWRNGDERGRARRTGARHGAGDECLGHQPRQCRQCQRALRAG